MEKPNYKFIKKQLQKLIKSTDPNLKMEDIDIQSNKTNSPCKIPTSTVKISDIQVSKIAFQLNFDLGGAEEEEVQDNSNNLYTMNEHLAFQSNIDGRS